jgi:adenylosuccinate lyase
LSDNDLLQRLAADDSIPFTLSDLESIISDFQQFTGRAREQTEEYLDETVRPRLNPYKDILGKVDAELSV